MNSATKGRRSGFTLIEIMVATVIMVVLVGLVIQITSEVLKVWNRSSGKLSANAEARIALDLLTQDLETAVFRNNGLCWLEAEEVNLGDPFSGSASFKTMKLKLFSPALDRSSGPGDICGISYLLRYSDPIDGSETIDTPEDRTFILYRNVIDPVTTFNSLIGVGRQETFTDPLWLDTATIYGGKNYLASNIIDFRIDFYVVDDGDSATETLVSTYSAGNTVYGGTNATVGSQATVEALKKPLAYAEITLKIISDEALEVIQNDVVDQSGFATDEEYVAANSEVFTRRVNFPARPL